MVHVVHIEIWMVNIFLCTSWVGSAFLENKNHKNRTVLACTLVVHCAYVCKSQQLKISCLLCAWPKSRLRCYTVNVFSLLPGLIRWTGKVIAYKISSQVHGCSHLYDEGSNSMHTASHMYLGSTHQQPLSLKTLLWHSPLYSCMSPQCHLDPLMSQWWALSGRYP